MSGKNEGTGKEGGSGTLRDEAGSSGQETTRGWGVLLKKSAGRQDLSSRVAAAPQDPVSEISGLEPLKAFLVPQEGDNDVVWVDEEEKELTGFQIRVLDRMKALKDMREDIALSESEDSPKVRRLNEELLNLKAFLNTAGSGALDGSSVMFDVERIAEQVKRESQAPRESSDHIAPELEKEGVEIPGEARPTGLGVGRSTPGGMAGTGIWNTLERGFFGEPVAPEPVGGRESSMPVRNSMIVDETDAAGEDADARPAAIPPKLRARVREGEQEEMVALIGGYPVLPLNQKERKLLSRPDELDYVQLREMALERRWQVEVIENGIKITETELEEYEWLERLHEEIEWEGRSGEDAWERVNSEIQCRLAEADALEAKSDRLNPANQIREEDDAEEEIGEGVPKGTVIRANASGKGTEAKGPSGAGVPKREAPAKRIETVLGLNAVIREAARENSQLLNIRQLAEMAQEEPETGSLPPDMFAGFEGEFDAAKEEGSAPLNITHLMGEKPRGDPRSVRLPTAKLKAVPGIAHLEGAGIRRLTPVERADTMIAAPGTGGNARVKGAGQEGIETAMLLPVEDFSRYGDIFYAIEQVYLESGERFGAEALEDFGMRLLFATARAGKIASEVVTIYDGDLNAVSPETRRFQRLKSFRKEFIEVEEGAELPKKDLNAYRLWLDKKRAEYREAEGVFETLGISPGEYSRRGILRVCDANIGSGTLDSAQKKQVNALVRMLEEKKSEGDADEFAAERNAELAYEMVVGFGTKKERALGKARIAEITRLEAELKEKKIEINTYLDKRNQMVRILSDIHAINRKEEEITREVTRQLGKELMDLEPDHQERKKLMGAMFSAIARKGEIGRDLMERAEEDAAQKFGIRKTTIDTTHLRAAEIPSRQYGPVASGIGNAIKMAAGAGILAAGLWLGQHGVQLPSFGGGTPEREVAADVQAASGEEGKVPAGVLDAAADAGSVQKVSRVVEAAPEPVGTDAEGIPAQEMDSDEEGAEEAQPETNEEYSRDKEGLKKALDAWCQEEHGLLVSKEILRAAYASIEGQLDGSVLPNDLEWAQLMLKMKFPNRVVELAIMSDLARSDLGHEEKYAVLMRLAIPIGDRARFPKSFPTSIKEANATGMELPKLDKESHLGKIEGVRKGQRCLAASYFTRVAERMGTVKEEALDAGMDKKQFREGVQGALGKRATDIEEQYERTKSGAMKEKRKGYCKALSGGNSGFDAVTRAMRVMEKWRKTHKKAKRAKENLQKELDGIIGAAPEGVRKEGKRAVAPKASPCAGKDGMELYSCVAEQNMKTKQVEKDAGEKKMHKPKKKDGFGSISKAPRMFVRY